MSRNPSRATARRAPVGAGASHPSARPLRPALAALVAALLSVGVGIGLVGCVPGPDASPSPTATAAGPRFASDEEALAAAEEAYAAYLAMSDRIAQDGGRDPERIAEFVTEEQLAVDIDSYQALRDAEVRQMGTAQLVASDLVSAELEGTTREIVMSVCVDYAGSRLVRSDSTEVETRREGSTVAAQVVMTSVDPGPFKVSMISPTSDDSC